jgi:hypothetical protein
MNACSFFLTRTFGHRVAGEMEKLQNFATKLKEARSRSSATSSGDEMRMRRVLALSIRGRSSASGDSKPDAHLGRVSFSSVSSIALPTMVLSAPFPVEAS